MKTSSEWYLGIVGPSFQCECHALQSLELIAETSFLPSASSGRLGVEASTPCLFHISRVLSVVLVKTGEAELEMRRVRTVSPLSDRSPSLRDIYRYIQLGHQVTSKEAPARPENSQRSQLSKSQIHALPFWSGIWRPEKIMCLVASWFNTQPTKYPSVVSLPSINLPCLSYPQNLSLESF